MAEKESKLTPSSVMEKDGLQEKERIITTKRKRESNSTRFVRSDEKFMTPSQLYEVPVVYLPVRESSDLIAIGRNFVSHILIANTGEDIMAKIISFGQTCACDVYIVSAIGHIARASLFRSSNFWTYEGSFSIISLTGHLSSTVEQNASGGIDTTITLMNKDGSSFGGFVCGPLIAAGEIQVYVIPVLAASAWSMITDFSTANMLPKKSILFQIVLWTCGDPFLKTTSAPASSSGENTKLIKGKGLIIP